MLQCFAEWETSGPQRRPSLKIVAVRCSLLQCVVVCCSLLQSVAVFCSLRQSGRNRGLKGSLLKRSCSVLQCVAVCRGVLRCDAVCCSVLQCAAACCSVRERGTSKEALSKDTKTHIFSSTPVQISQKVSSILIPYSELSSELTFENFYICTSWQQVSNVASTVMLQCIS